METLISVFTFVLEFFAAMKRFLAGLMVPLNSIEVMIGLLFLVVTVAGMSAFGPWTRPRKPGEFPWE